MAMTSTAPPAAAPAITPMLPPDEPPVDPVDELLALDTAVVLAAETVIVAGFRMGIIEPVVKAAVFVLVISWLEVILLAAVVALLAWAADITATKLTWRARRDAVEVTEAPLR